MEFVTMYYFCFMFWFLDHEACGILAPQPGLELVPPALEGGFLTTGLPGKSPAAHVFLIGNIAPKVFLRWRWVRGKGM